ncbi:MAG: hypothetical protein IPJ65_08650 [Archangiaceae bacterium]|nr:hypothetical protein [Archangiaceae bacterium]
MPPDVFLALASSGISLIASLMFLVAAPPSREDEYDDPRFHVPFLLPPSRARPPPLPRARECTVGLLQSSLQAVVGIKLSGDDFVVTLECAPHRDAPALQVAADGRGHGTVSDLRWHGKAGLAHATRSEWKLKPGRA